MSEVASAGQLRMALLRRALFTIPLILFLGFLSGQLAGSGGANRWYAMLAKPEGTPPPFIFPIAWTILYVLMGVALAFVLHARGAKYRGYAIALFVIQFVLMLAWTPIFFGAHKVTLALAVLAGLFLAALATTMAFYRVRVAAAWLMIPYLAWLLFAGYLNFEILRLNPDAEKLVPRQGSTQIEFRR